MSALWQDLRYGARVLRRTPGFSAAVIAILALAIGGNTAIFSLLDAALLRPLPYRDPERLVMVWERNYRRDQQRNVVNPGNYLRWREHNRVFESMTGFITWPLNVVAGRSAERLPIGLVSTGFFEVLGVAAARGRALQPQDYAPGSEPLAVLSDGYWRRRFGADPRVLGSSLKISGEPATIVGVMPPEFAMPAADLAGGRTAELWTQLPLTEEHRESTGRWMSVAARIQPGVPLARAIAEMEALGRRLEHGRGDHNVGWGIQVIPLRDDLVGAQRPALLVLFGAVGFVLLIACANIANLMLARAAGRERELAVRRALGAGRGRLIVQLATESLLLAISGAAVGLLLALWGIEALFQFAPVDLPLPVPIGFSGKLLGVALGLALLSALLFGLAPAWLSARAETAVALQEGAHRSSGPRRRRRLNGALVMAEIALALVLLTGAGLLLRSFVRQLEIDPGFDGTGVLSFQLNLPGSVYQDPARQVALFERACERIGRIPGVSSAGAISWLPLAGLGSATSFEPLDRPRPRAGDQPVADVRVVTTDYFRTLRIPLIRGRLFDHRDRADAPKAVLIDQALARRFWPNADPVGKRIAMDWGERMIAEVVGVVGDVRLTSLTSAPRSTLYWALPQLPNSFMSLMVRSTVEPGGIVPAIRARLAELDPELPLAEIQTMDQVVSDSVRQPRLLAVLVGAFAGVALVLAALGVYAVMAYTVARRTHEIGIRMAIGARHGDIVRLVLGRTAILALVGVGLGLAGAASLTGALESLLYEVSPTDPTTLVVVTVVLALVAVVASLLPALRASRVDPLIALRYE
jgi:putative ABC transport system permease protein